jgi:hypothetical protein
MSLRDGADARPLTAGARISRGDEPTASRRNRTLGAAGRPGGDSFPRKRMLGLERGPRSRPGCRRPASEVSEVRYGSTTGAAEMGRAADAHSTTAAEMRRAADVHSTTTAAEMRCSADVHPTAAADAHPAATAEMASASRNSAAAEMWRSASASAASAGACASDVRHGAYKNGCYCDDTESASIWHATLGRPPRVLSDVRR